MTEREATIQQAKSQAVEELTSRLATADLQKLEQDLHSAQDKLEALRTEYESGNAALGQAAQSGDADRLTALSLRLQELPTIILSAEFATVEAELRLIEAQRPTVTELAASYTFERLQPLRQEQERIANEIRALEAQRNVVAERADSLRHKRITLRNRRAEIVAQLQSMSTPFPLRKRPQVMV